MFGFDRVAAFTHDFETAFDLVRKGKIDANHDIVTVSLSAQRLHPRPDRGSRRHRPDHRRGHRRGTAASDRPRRCARSARRRSPGRSVVRAGPGRLADRHRLRASRCCATAPTRSPCSTICASSAPARSFPTSPACPASPSSNPKACQLGWSITLNADCTRDAIEDVFMFVRDEMELEIAPLASDRCPCGLRAGYGRGRHRGECRRRRKPNPLTRCPSWWRRRRRSSASSPIAARRTRAPPCASRPSASTS